MVINIHAGHNADGKIACGAIGLIKESTEARKVKNEVIRELKALGHTAYDCTVDNAKNEDDNLFEIVKKCNAHKADLDVSIHFNSGRKDKRGDGDNAGVEVWLYNSSSKAKKYAEKVCKEISKLGFDNRGLQYSTGLYVLRHTNAPAMLVECCFVDDKDDVRLYNYKTMATAIVKGIDGKASEKKKNTEKENENGKDTYKVQVGAYKNKENAKTMLKELEDSGFDAIIVK